MPSTVQRQALTFPPKVDAFKVIRDFEVAIAAYTGAPYVVAVDSGPSAIFLVLMWHKWKSRLPSQIEIPKLTDVSVAMQIRHAGASIRFRDEQWSGTYQIVPLPVWDCASRFRAAMHDSGHFMCTSHDWDSPLPIGQGGCILHDDSEADKWLRRARADGRTEGTEAQKDRFDQPGWHAAMTPEAAAAGLVRLSRLKGDNHDVSRDGYADLSTAPIFK